MPYVVTRQCYPLSEMGEGILDNQFVVEIASGGIDYSNPYALTPCHADEMEETNNPLDALHTALDIAADWARDMQSIQATPECPNVKRPITMPPIVYGHTGGYTMPFDNPHYPNSVSDRTALFAHFTAAFDRMPKCDRCGDILPKANQTWKLDTAFDETFCSENCANLAAEEYFGDFDDTDTDTDTSN